LTFLPNKRNFNLEVADKSDVLAAQGPKGHLDETNKSKTINKKWLYVSPDHNLKRAWIPKIKIETIKDLTIAYPRFQKVPRIQKNQTFGGDIVIFSSISLL
jgi:hypothetical protein